MNDFTKEELEDILQSYEECFRPFSPREQSIVNKLQSMIDNYCEHESKIDIGEAPMICKKCGKVTG